MSFYDGQMPFETTDVATSGTTVTDNAIGSEGDRFDDRDNLEWRRNVISIV